MAKAVQVFVSQWNFKIFRRKMRIEKVQHLLIFEMNILNRNAEKKFEETTDFFLYNKAGLDEYLGLKFTQEYIH